MSQYRFDTIKSTLNAPRTLFTQPHNYKTTFNAGKLIPVYCKEVLPGDTWSINLSAVVRELTLLNPVMDNSYIQFDAFFVKMVDIWDKTKQFFGENETGVWTETNEYEMPSSFMDIANGSNQLYSCTLGDYFGLPVGVAEVDQSEKVNYLPLRGYPLVYNYYYLNEATQAPVLFTKGNEIEFDSRLSLGYASEPLNVNRFADLFTTALPQPQKGPNVPFLADYLPVIPRNETINFSDLEGIDNNKYGSLYWGKVAGGYPPDTNPYHLEVLSPDKQLILGLSGEDGGYGTGITTGFSSDDSLNAITKAFPANLYASTINSGLRDINSFRIAAATQQFYEQLSRGGSRFSEYIKGLYNVNVPANEIGVPTYLGSVKKLINVNQVLSTADNANAILGTTGAYSHTALNNEHICTGSFNQFGYLYIFAHVRTDNSYSQGIPKMFSKKTKFDIYNPLFANIGNVGIKNKELYFSDDSEKDNEIFGYQEAWYEYKHSPNISTGYMRPGVDNSFSSWTYGRVFDSTPVLNEDFVLQTADEVDRTIAVQSEISNQFKLDLFVDAKVSRVMPLYSIPGLTKI